jgi:hypothetical protein
MARIAALGAHLERLTANFVDGVVAVLRDEFVMRAPRQEDSWPVARIADRASAAARANARRTGDERASGVPDTPASFPTRETDTLTRTDPPNAVTDPEFLLAALEQRVDEPSSTPAITRVRSRPQSKASRRPSKLAASGNVATHEPISAEPVAGPALRGDEVSVRTPRGGVVIKRARRPSEVV